MAKLYPAQPILLVDDEPAFLQSLSLTLKRQAGINHLVQCSDSREVAGLLAEQPFSLAIFDMMMPHLSGEQLLEQVRLSHPELPVIILTGMNQVELAVGCIKAGAFDFFVKTGESERLLAGIGRALKQTELQRENQQLKQRLLQQQLETPEAFADITTCSEQMQAVFRYVEAVARSTEPVLITGESGVGKELIAQAIHKLSRPQGEWVAVNVAGLDDNVFADSLFGHLRGAFTGAEQPRAGLIERAAGGTLFLDEIGDLSLESQVKLLRLLQEGEYQPLGSDRPKHSTARILVATNCDLAQLQQQGKFRADLYYRLRAHHVQLPPLRERKEDLPLLLDRFLAEAAAAFDKPQPTPPEQLPVLLSLYPFPGNIRELRAMVFDAVGQHPGGVLSMTSFEQQIGLDRSSQPPQAPAAGVTFHQQLPTLKQVADLLVREAMRRTGGNQTLAAKLLGISQPSLSSRLKKLSP